MSERKRPFMVLVLAIQNGLAGLSFLTLVLFGLSSGLLSGGLGMMIIIYGALVWAPLLLVGIYMFVTARGLYDLRKYGLYMAIIASIFWILISIAIFAFTSPYSDVQTMPTLPLPIPSDLPPEFRQVAAQLPDLLRTGLFLLLGVVRGYFLGTLIYNLIIILYLWSVRDSFQERIAPSAAISQAPAAPRPPAAST